MVRVGLWLRFTPIGPFVRDIRRLNGEIHSVPAAFQAAMPRCPLDNALASFVQALRNFSTSASVVVQPRLTRTAPRRCVGETPIAARTCDGCTLPEEQAAPEDTATPSRSKAITAVSALIPASANSEVFGSRSTPPSRPNTT